MKVIGIIIVLCCPMVIAAKLSEEYVKSASSKFRKVNSKPSGVTLTAVEDGVQHIRQCMKSCLLTPDCLTIVYDEDLGRCSLYNSSTITEALSDGETAMMKEVTTKEVSCVALKYNEEFGGCVQLFTTPKTWADAEAECQRLHERSHLVTITDERKDLALNKLADAAGVEVYYIGGRAAHSGAWTNVWDTTGDRMSYTNWKPGEPSNTHQNCVMVTKDSGIYKWNDIHCTYQIDFICELK